MACVCDTFVLACVCDTFVFILPLTGVHTAFADEDKGRVHQLLQVHNSHGQVQGWQGAHVTGLLVLRREAFGNHIAPAGNQH